MTAQETADNGISEQIPVKNELMESEARIRAITDSVNDAILMMNPNGIITFWNPAAVRMLGYSEAEAIGQNLHALIAPAKFHEAHKAALPMFQQTGQGNAIRKTLDMKACRKDNSEIHVQLSLSAIDMDDGWHSVGIIRDVTDRKLAEELLKESEMRLIAAQKMAYVGNWELNLKTKTMWASEEAFNIYGIDYNPVYISLVLARESVLPEYSRMRDNTLNNLINQNFVKPWEKVLDCLNIKSRNLKRLDCFMILEK